METGNEDIVYLPVDFLKLSTKTKNALKNAGVNSILHLLKMSERELKLTYMIGPLARKQISRELEKIKSDLLFIE